MPDLPRDRPAAPAATPLDTFLDCEIRSFRTAVQAGGEAALFWQRLWQANLQAAVALMGCRSAADAFEVMRGHAGACLQREAEAAQRISRGIAGCRPNRSATGAASRPSKTATAADTLTDAPHPAEWKANR